ncbi:MAG: hypothetical protein PHC75_08010 [Burkholderiales bacterium]|nr:hypothetical protein [Burkholderiales bacterium]
MSYCKHEFTTFVKRITMDECDPEIFESVYKCKHCNAEQHTQLQFVDEWIENDSNEDN